MSFRIINFNKPYICLYNHPYWHLNRSTGLNGRYAIGTSIHFQVGKNMRTVVPPNQKDQTHYIWHWYTTKTLLPRQLNCIITREVKVKLLDTIKDELYDLQYYSKTIDHWNEKYPQDEIGMDQDTAILRLRSTQNLLAAESMITRLLTRNKK